MLGADHRAWLVRVHALPLEIELAGRLLLLTNDDAPGMVGRVGTLLGDAGINIANMTLSRSRAGGDAMMAFALDDDPPGDDPDDALDAAGSARAAALRTPQLAIRVPARGTVSSNSPALESVFMHETEKIWMNGELVGWQDAKVHVLSHVMHYGSGVFEGIRAYATDRGPAVFRLMDHLRRLERSSEIYFMELPYSIEELRAATHEVIAANGLDACYVRPLAYRGYGELGINPLNCPVDVIIAVWPWGAYLGEEALEHGVRVMTSSWRRIGPNTLPAAAKASGQYLNSQLAKMEAMHAGYDEAILLNEQGFLADGSGENVFVDPGRRALDAAGHVVVPARHHARHGHPDRARDGLRGARGGRRAQQPLPRRRGLLHGHGRRDHADPLGRRSRDRPRPDHEAHPDRVLRDHHRALASSRPSTSTTPPTTPAKA